jgi:hypothetical protein
MNPAATMVESLLFKIGWSGFSLIFVLVGLYTMRAGHGKRGRSERIAETETTRVRDLTAGTAEVKGTAHPADDASLMESPITVADALATRVEVEKYQSSSEGGGSWKTLHEENSAVPMVVDDGTGEVRVELPDDGGLNVELIRNRVGGGEEPPAMRPAGTARTTPSMSRPSRATSSCRISPRNGSSPGWCCERACRHSAV